MPPERSHACTSRRLRVRPVRGCRRLCAAPFADGLASTKAWAADPVPITTADELRAVKAGDSTVSYILMADIDLGGAEWTPIGKPSGFNDDSGSGFRGMFDGNGHTIKNFTVSSFSTNAGIWYAGFFGPRTGPPSKTSRFKTRPSQELPGPEPTSWRARSSAWR